jgi:PAS domain S-box-containing protein
VTHVIAAHFDVFDGADYGPRLRFEYERRAVSLGHAFPWGMHGPSSTQCAAMPGLRLCVAVFGAPRDAGSLAMAVTFDDDGLADLAGASAAMLQSLSARWRARLQAGHLGGRDPAQCQELVARLDLAADVLARGAKGATPAARPASVRPAEASQTPTEERFRLLVDSVQDYAIFMLDAGGHVASWNVGAERLKGYRADEILGRHFSAFYSADDIARGHPDMELRVAMRDGRFAEEGWRIRKDGSRFWASVVITAMRDAAGGVTGFAKVTRDLTERRRAEDAVRLREEQLATTLQSIGDAVIATNESGHVTMMNPVAEALTGWTRANALGRPLEEVFEIVNEDTRARAQNPVARVLREGVVLGLANHTALIARDGTARPIADSAAPIRAATGEITGVVLVFRDQTADRAAERVLRENEQRLATTLHSIGDAVIATDATGRVALMNPVAEALTGWSQGEALGRRLADVFDIVNEETRAPAKSPVDRVLREGTVVGLANHTALIARGGTARPIADSAAPIRALDGSVSGVVLVFRDQSQERAAETERLRLAHAQEAVRMRDEFLSIAAHELRTPITALQLQLDSLAQTARAAGTSADSPLARKAEKAQQQSVRLTTLVDTLLDLSRITAGRFEIAREELDLASLVAGAVENLRAEAANMGCTIRLEAPVPVRGFWDAMRLEQITTNLLSNALKFGRGHPIDVRVGVAGNRARLTVDDGGIGIPPHDLDRIFGRFERGASPNHYGGLGLGLYLTRAYVEAHGGTIRADNKPGQGATFEVDLPLSPPSTVPTGGPAP